MNNNEPQKTNGKPGAVNRRAEENANLAAGSRETGSSGSDGKVLRKKATGGGARDTETAELPPIEPYEIDPTLQNLFAERLLQEREKNKRPNGNWLAPSRLGWPVQWQVLYALGVPAKVPDEYTLRKFDRGKDVENKVLDMCGIPVDNRQIPIEYRGMKGYMDFTKGIPHEIKSVTNMKFKHIQKQGADRSHKLQAAVYAMAVAAPKYAVCYVASDDYRILTMVYDLTEERYKEVNDIITTFEEFMDKKVIPKFEPIEKWQASEDYMMYPSWAKLTEDELKTRAKELFAKYKRQ